MIWNVFDKLVISGQRMHVPNNGQEMVHRDLKPGNIFLGTHDPVSYPDYPRPLVADFGHAIMTSAPDERNPDWYCGGCATVGFTPPELEQYVDPATFLPLSSVANAPQILEWTNVWQVGAILRSLVLLDPNPYRSLYLDGPLDTTYQVVGSPELKAPYHPSLLQMIDSMMSFDVNQRPTFNQLANDRQALNAAALPPHANDITRGFVNGTATPAEVAANRIHIAQDSYANGMLPPAAVP